VVETYFPGGRAEHPSEPVGVSSLAAAVWTLLSEGGADLDALSGRWTTGFPGPGPVLAALAELEVAGWITRGPGASWVRRAA
jgi:hypothetical protein